MSQFQLGIAEYPDTSVRNVRKFTTFVFYKGKVKFDIYDDVFE